MKRGKKFTAAAQLITNGKAYSFAEGFELIPKVKISNKFDETVEIAIRLGVDPKYADQMIRGAINLPHGTGKSLRVAVFAKGDKAREAVEAGADLVGAEDLAQRVQDENGLSVDAVVASPDMMILVGKVGRILGPRGLMPNPKVGTVTNDIGKVVRDLKGGRVEFRVEKAGIVQAGIGKVSFGPQKLQENAKALIEFLLKLKPSTAKGIYMKSISISTTFGPGVRLDPGEVYQVANPR